MSHLFDTQLLLWALYETRKLSARARSVLNNPLIEPFFSSISVLEVSIKTARDRADFQVDPDDFATQLRLAGFGEIAATSKHAVQFLKVPALHKDPFDRLLIAQAMAEDLILVTADKTIAKYPGNILRV